MSTRVLLSGVPKNVRQAKLLNMLCNILQIDRADFHAHVPPFNGPVKDVLLTFQDLHDAQSAQENLDNFIFTYNNDTYVFNAKIEMDYQRKNGKDMYKRSRKSYQSPPRQYSRDTRERYGDGHRRNRSRSPLYSTEASRLDMQIEILKKQRMILEEERKLLEEQQRLDDIKMGSFKKDRHSKSKRSFNEDYEFNVEEKTKDVPINLLQKKFEPKILSYYRASGVLISKMYALIEKYSTKENRKLLISLIRPALKERFAAALENQPFYQTHKVIQIYRTVHPVDGDEDFVKEIAKSMNENESSDNTQAEGGNDGNATDKAGNVESAKEGSSTEEIFDATHTEPLPVKISGKKLKLVYHQSTGILIKKLNVHMDKHCPPEKRAKLVTLLRAELRKRLEAIAEGNNIHQSARMIKFYRAAHPATEDEEFVVSVLKTIDQDSGDGANKGRGVKDVVDKNNSTKKRSDVSVTTTKTKKINENKTDSIKSQNVGESTEGAKGNPPEEEKGADDNVVQERADTETTTKSGKNEITGEETKASETTDKPDESESSQNNEKSVESTKDGDHSGEVKASIVEGKDANKENNPDTVVELQEVVVTKAMPESGLDQSATRKINIDDSGNTVTKTEEKNDIQTNMQENLINNTIDKSYASVQPDFNCEAVDLQSDHTALAQDANDTNAKENNRGIKRKNEEIEVEGTKIAKNSVLATSDDVDEVNLVNADDNGVEN